MAETLHLNKHVILLLAFISCLQFLFTEARPIKHSSTDTINLHQSMQTGSFSDVAVPSKDDFPPTAPGFSPGVGHPKAVVASSSKDDYNNLHKSSQTPDDNVQQPVSGKENGFYASTAASKDDFRPIKHSSTDTINYDFRPKTPGISPGIGHPKTVVPSSNIEQHDHNALHKSSHIPGNVQKSVPMPPSVSTTGLDVSVASSKDAFRPTAPGFSPGVGHPKAVVASSNIEQNDHNALHKSSHIPSNVQQSVPMSPPVSTTGYDVSAASLKDDFRPTAPGFSPGAGHPANTGVTSSDIKHSVTGIKNDYNNLHKSSHIPDNVQPGNKETSQPVSATGFEVSAASSKDDFRPTAPGFSPGVGHPKKVATSSSTKHSVTGLTNDYRPTQPGHSPGVGHSYQKNNAGQNP